MTEDALMEITDAEIVAQGSPEAFKKAFDNYISIQKIIDARMPDALMQIQGKVFRKKTYWRAVAKGFSLSVKEVKESYFTHGNDWGYRVLYEAVAPNGQIAAGDGTCMASEKAVYDYEWNGRKKGKRLGVNLEKTEANATQHNVRGHAHTRAFNRAVSNLVGFGEVSADEINQEAPYTPAEEVPKEGFSDDPPAKKTTQKAATQPTQMTATQAQEAQEQAPKSNRGSGDWDGQKEVFFGKYSKEDPPKLWSEIPAKYLVWITENMDAGKGPANGMAVQEISRRALLEGVPAATVESAQRAFDDGALTPEQEKMMEHNDAQATDAEMEERFQ